MNSKNSDAPSQLPAGWLILELADSTGAADMSVNIPVDAALLYLLTQISKGGIFKTVGARILSLEHLNPPESLSN